MAECLAPSKHATNVSSWSYLQLYKYPYYLSYIPEWHSLPMLPTKLKWLLHIIYLLTYLIERAWEKPSQRPRLKHKVYIKAWYRDSHLKSLIFQPNCSNLYFSTFTFEDYFSDIPTVPGPLFFTKFLDVWFSMMWVNPNNEDSSRKHDEQVDRKSVRI